MEIGSGTYSKVIRDYKSKVVIKVFKEKFSHAAIKEIAIMNYIDSKYVIKPADVDYRDGTWKIYMRMYAYDLSIRDNLYDYSESDQGSLVRILCIIRDIIGGVNTMHRKRVIHGDIKPHNILVKDDGAVLCDFNVSVFNPGAFNTSRIQTPLYRAPEVDLTRSKCEYNYKVDIWSVGAVIYELLTNEYALDPRVCTNSAYANALEMYGEMLPNPLEYWRIRITNNLMIDIPDGCAAPCVALFAYICAGCMSIDTSARWSAGQLVHEYNKLLSLFNIDIIEDEAMDLPLCVIDTLENNSINSTITDMYIEVLAKNGAQMLIQEYKLFSDLPAHIRHHAQMLDARLYAIEGQKKAPMAGDSVMTICACVYIVCCIYQVPIPRVCTHWFNESYVYERAVECASVLGFLFVV